MNVRVVLSLVSALAVLFCGAPGSITALHWPPFGGPAAYAGEADAPVIGSSAQPGSAGSGSASGNVGAPAQVPGVPGSAVAAPSAVKHREVVDRLGRHIAVPHDSEQCAQALKLAVAANQAVLVQDKECQAVMADILKVQRNPPPWEHHDHEPIATVYGLIIPHNSRTCARAVDVALHRHKPVPAPDEECRSVMLKALEIQRTTPPPHRLPRPPAIMLPDAVPMPGTFDASGAPAAQAAAPEEPAAGNAAPNAEGAAPPRTLVPHGGLLRIVPNVPQDGE